MKFLINMPLSPVLATCGNDTIIEVAAGEAFIGEPMVELGVFKTFWDRRQNDGRWQIVGMKGISLKPQTPSDGDCFAIQNEIVLVQGAPIIGTIQSILGSSIVPVVAAVAGENVVRCIGTAFFISCTGLLITAAHVITDPIEREYGDVVELEDFNVYGRKLNFGVLVPNNPVFQPRGYRFFPFEWSAFLAERREDPLRLFGLDLRLNSDVALCKVAMPPNGPPHQPLTVVQAGIQGIGMGVGSNAIALGYAGMSEEILLSDRREIIGDPSFRLHVSVGGITEQYPDNALNQTVSTPGPCFAFSARIAGGMSGSPIFDREGIYVHGVVSKGLQDETGIAKVGFGSMLAPSMWLSIGKMNGRNLKQIQESHDEGMPILRGAGL
ncbi:MAG TPA: serine protease [Acetobacteraceae bacterium]